MVHLGKGRFTHHMAVIVGPAPQQGVELTDQLTRRGGFIRLDDFSYPPEKRLNAFTRGLNQQFVPLYMRMFCPRKLNP